MIGDTFLAFYSNIGGGAIGDLLFRWEQAGVFSYVLPFLLIFAMIYGLLNKLNFFGKKDDTGNGAKGINLVISVAVALMALQFNIVGVFFSEIFPKVGVGLAVILALLILMGLFWPSDNAFNWAMVFFGLIVAGYVIFSSLGVLGSIFGPSISAWGLGTLDWGTIIGILVFVALFVAVVAPNIFKKNTATKATGNPLQNAITAALRP
jgi:hypothetical protein